MTTRAQPGEVAELSHVAPRSEASGGKVVARRWWPGWVCFCLYSVLTIVEFGPSNSLGAGEITGSLNPDQIQQLWYLQWTPYALLHGHNPFFSQFQNYPAGLNSLVNPSMVALGTAFSPITSLFGPVVTWNVLVRLAVVVSATSMCLVLRRWTTWWPAAFVGGLLYGFSAYMNVNVAHVFLIFVPLPPLILLLFHEILVRQQWRPTRTGALLGATCAVQYLISSEILVSTLLMGATASVLYLLVRKKELAGKWPFIKTAIVYCCAVGGILLVYPVLFTLFGPGSDNGAVAAAGAGPGDLLSPFVPGSSLLLNPSVFNGVWTNLLTYFSGFGMYLGIPFFLAFIAIVIWLRRSQIVLLAGAMTVVALILSLGSTLHVDGRNTQLPLPFIFLAHIPLLDGLVASRFSLFTVLFGAGVLAIGLDRFYKRLRRSSRPEWLKQKSRTIFAVGVSLTLAVIVIAPSIPRHTQVTSSTQMAPLLTSSQDSSIPVGSVVLAYPYPSRPVSLPVYVPYVSTKVDALFDQLESGMRYKLVGGYGFTSRGVLDPSILSPVSVQTFFDVSYYGTSTPTQSNTLFKSDLTTDLRLFMRNYHVDTVIVLPLGQHPTTVIGHVTAAIGPPSHLGSVSVWFHVQDRLAALSRSVRSP
jgi:hypothetical protein